jgi:hypothetical protein
LEIPVGKNPIQAIFQATIHTETQLFEAQETKSGVAQTISAQNAFVCIASLRIRTAASWTFTPG